MTETATNAPSAQTGRWGAEHVQRRRPGRIEIVRRGALHILVEDYGWIHLGLGMMGHAVFIAASALLLASNPLNLPMVSGSVDPGILGRWLFIVGSSLMFIGSFGELLVSLYSRRRRRRRAQS